MDRAPRATRRVRLQESTQTTVVERTFTAASRKKMADSGAAMDDGAYPIANATDLTNAIKAVGRGGADHDTIRAHIIKRARALNLADKIPDNWGSDGAIKEAVTLSSEEIASQIQGMLADAARPARPTMPEMDCGYIRATYPDRVIISKGGELYQLPYTVDANGDITLGTPEEVVVAYQPVANDTPAQEQAEDAGAAAALAAMEASNRPASATSGADPAHAGAPVEIDEAGAGIVGLAEADGAARGAAWDVLLIKAGLSGNRRFYPAAMLEAAVPLFEGCPAYADHPSRTEQRDRPERSVRDVVGWYEGVRWDVSEQAIRATFRILESADWLRATLKSAWDAGKRDLLGFSIAAIGSAANQKRADGSTLIESLERVISTDVVTTPGAGGRLLGVLESERGSGSESDMNEEQIRKLIAEAMAAGLTGLQAQLTETLKTMLADGGSTGGTATAVAESTATTTTETTTPDPATVALQEAQTVLADIRRENLRTHVVNRVDAAKLPTAHATKLKARLLEAVARRAVEDTEVDAEIQYIRDLIAESGPARPNWSGGTIDVGDSEADQMKKALMGWFQSEKIDGVEPVRDLKESYCRWSHQSFYDVSAVDMFRAFMGGYDSEVQHKRLSESLTQADWAQVFGDVFYLQMMRAYQASPEYNQWRQFVSEIEGPTDFRTRHWAAIGGYGDLETVGELQTYPELASPGDEETTYSLSKRGGIDSISMEMVLGDRLQQVRRMPQLMAYAASRGIYKFVMNMITTDNPTLGYDSVALYNAAHANTGTTGLTVAGLDLVNVAMRSQTARLNAADILGARNKPRFIIVPNTLETIAQRVLKPSQSYLAQVSNAGTDTTVDPSRWAAANIDYHVYDYLTDTNDWFTIADPSMMETLVVGFLNGRQDPELFTQDQANVGGVFSADRISYKVRFIYGGAVLDHRSFYRQVV